MFCQKAILLQKCDITVFFWTGYKIKKKKKFVWRVGQQAAYEKRFVNEVRRQSNLIYDCDIYQIYS